MRTGVGLVSFVASLVPLHVARLVGPELAVRAFVLPDSLAVGFSVPERILKLLSCCYWCKWRHLVVSSDTSVPTYRI